MTSTTGENGGSGGPRSAIAQISLRLRLTLWIAAIALVIHLTLSIIVLLYQRVSVQEFFDARYRPRVMGIIADLRKVDYVVDESRWNELVKHNLGTPLNEPFLVTLYQPSGPGPGRVVISTSLVPPQVEEVQAWLGANHQSTVHRDTGPRTVNSGQVLERARTFVQRLTSPSEQDYILAVTVSDVASSSVLAVLSSVLMITIPAGVLAAGVAGYLISGMIIRPIQELRLITGAMAPDALDRPVTLAISVPEIAVLQNELEESRSRLRAALISHDRFISNVSHELKTPVAVLLLEAQTMDRDGLNVEQRRFVDSVADEMRRLGRMVESFLTLTRVKTGKAIAHAERCDINEVVMRSVVTCSSMARQQSIVIEPQLLDVADGAVILGDAELLRVMVDNLIRNAIRFSPSQGTVSISVESDASRWLVRVRDLGPGIPPEIMGTIFDRFTQAPTENVRGRGYGLGLSIAQGIAELHAGSISVHNTEPGCEFIIALPRATQLTIESAAVSRAS
jgi:two-component system OmpR family sensor kinase